MEAVFYRCETFLDDAPKLPIELETVDNILKPM